MRRWSAFALLFAAACADEASLTPGEELPGGETTNAILFGGNAYSSPVANLDASRRDPFFTGNSFFNQNWVQAPASTTARDGLGPTFNARSCSGCHFRDGRGAPPEDGHSAVALLFRLSLAGEEAAPDPVYGGQIQPLGVDGVPGEGNVEISYVERNGTYADGTSYSLRVPHYDFDGLALGPLGPNTRYSPRVAPAMIGLGLLEAVSDARLRELADPEDEDGDGVSGRVREVWDSETRSMRIGRFGWKAEQPTVLAQSAGAFAGDIGVTSSLVPHEECPPGQDACRDAARGGEPEIEDELLGAVAIYSRTLAVPARRRAKHVLEGRALFEEAQCASCHVRSLETGELDGFEELSQQTIWPYTDLLLHDLGDDLSDDRELPGVSPREWRTPPLWGLSHLEDVNGHMQLLHDGRARGVAEAILWHGGEAEASRDLFRGMSEEEREALVRFVESL